MTLLSATIYTAVQLSELGLVMGAAVLPVHLRNIYTRHAMGRMKDLLGDASPPFVADSDTSEAAADSIATDAASLRGRCLEIIKAAGLAGKSCDDVEHIMGGRHQTISARIRELVQMGLIEDSGRRKATRSGRNARVYVMKKAEAA